MIQAVVQRRGERQRRQRVLAIDVKNNGQADPHQQQPDIFNRRIRQQPLHIALHGGEHHAENRGHQTQRQRQHTPPPLLHTEQIEGDAQDAVDRRFQHDAAHQCGNRRGRSRVSFGQPDVQRQQTRFRAKAEQRQQKRHR